jgi:uncharacterized protein
MPLFKLLILIIVVAGAFYIYRRIKGKPAAPQPPQEMRSTRAVKCELCGLHVPEEEAVRRDHHVYCCQDHADKASRQ